MKKREKGQVLILVLILLALGALLITPTLSLGWTALKNKRIQTAVLNEQYAIGAGAEYAMWQLLYGGAAALLSGPGSEENYTININGVATRVIIRMQATLGNAQVAGADDNRIRPTKTVVCARDGDGLFNDDCLALPAQSGMVAQYTVFLDQVSPDISVGLTTIYDELPVGFSLVPGSVTSPDGSFPQILTVTPVDIQPGGNEIWKWLFPAPVYFQQGEVKQFRFLANIRSSRDRYCNRVFLRLQENPPEQSAPTAVILVGSNPPAGCNNGGTKVVKYVDRLVALPNQVNTFTYVVGVENVDQSTLHIDSLTDVLPQGGFQYCNPSSTPPCDPPKYKIVNDPFNPQAPNAFTDTTGYTNLPNPVQTWMTPDNRWKLNWGGLGTAGNISAAGQAGDTFLLRFQARITPTTSGSYYDEVFIYIDSGCAAPIVLVNEGVTSQQEYCDSYSWPTGGVAVPTYDVRSDALRFSGQGNVIIDWSLNDAQLNSWHVN